MATSNLAQFIRDMVDHAHGNAVLEMRHYGDFSQEQLEEMVAVIDERDELFRELKQQRETLDRVDDIICDIISGNQGSFEPAHGTVRMGELALKVIRGRA